MSKAPNQIVSRRWRGATVRVIQAAATCCGFWLLAIALTNLDLAAAQAGSHARPNSGLAINVAGRDFDPLKNASRTFGVATQDVLGRGLRLVQWQQPITQADLDRLQAEGIEALQYYPQRAFLVWTDQPALSRISSNPAVRWAGDFGPGLKQSPELGNRRGLIDRVNVHFYANGAPHTMLQTLAGLGAEVVGYAPAQPDRRVYDAFVRIEAGRLTALANLPEVIWLGYASPQAMAEDELTAQIVVGNAPNGAPTLPGYLGYLSGLGLDGSGVIWGVSDEGVDLDHPDLSSRIVSGYSFPGCLPGDGPGDDSPSGGHGTHVAGILGGTGAGAFTDSAGFLYGLGVAPGVGIHAQNILCRGGTPSFPPEGGWQSMSKRAFRGGAVGTNASFTTGEGTRHGYQAIERLFDFMVRNADFDTIVESEPLTIVFSAGNSGPAVSSLTAPKEAKNVIVVGATESPRAGDPNTILERSSRGPAQDGRIVPTIAAPGQSITSARRVEGGSLCNEPEIPDTAGLYAHCSGTSMAAPHASGLAALLVQWWRNEFAGADPSPAMLKALLIEGAEPANELLGSTPNADEGWGRAMLPQMVRSADPPWAVDQSRVLDNNGERDRFAFVPVDPESPVRVVVVWTDAPGAVGANPALVNDLDLQVQRGSSHYAGNSSANGASQILPGDRINNAEAIFLDASDEPFVVRVKAHSLPGDAIPHFGDATDQDYALLCHNCKPVSGFDTGPGITLARICAGDSAQFELPVTLTGTQLGVIEASLRDVPGGLNATLMLTSLSTDGIFEVTISGTGALLEGAYEFDLALDATGFALAQTLQLDVAQTPPSLVTLEGPVDGIEVSSLGPTLRWNQQSGADTYQLEVSLYADFSNPLVNLELTATEFRVDQNLAAEADVYWRVTALNSCGAAASAATSFRTPAAPGSCPAGTRKVLLYDDDLEPPDSGWVVVDEGAFNTWAPSTARSQSPNSSWRAIGLAQPRDQKLDSPALILPPASERPVLSFSHWRNIERRSAAECWDGGVFDLVTSQGTPVTPAADEYQLGRPERIFTDTSSSAGLPAWCGVAGFEPVYVDLRNYAEQTVRARFRLITDDTGGREGWYIDDLQVHSCVADEILFRSGMGAEPN